MFSNLSYSAFSIYHTLPISETYFLQQNKLYKNKGGDGDDIFRKVFLNSM